MRSGELARLAGVSVRTLRHYHAVGVLAEPDRGVNGYRHYDVHDLIRLIRIRRLAALGIALEQMPPLLDGAADTGSLLDELDSQMAAQIARLTAQREVIARLRTHDVPPDLPPELAPYLEVFAAAALSPRLARIDREQSILVAHLVGDEGVADLARLYERLSAAALAPAVAEVAEMFDRIGPDSTPEDRAAFLERFIGTFRPVLDELPEGSFAGLADGTTLFTQYTDDVLNAQQRDVLDELTRLLDTGQRPGD